MTVRMPLLALLLAVPAGPSMPATVPSAPSAAAVSDGLQVSGGEVTVICRLTLGGSFEAKSSRLEGQLAKGAESGALEGTLRVPLDTLDTGISLRNAHMRDNYLETGKGPDFSHARLTDITLDRAVAADEGGRTPFGAQLTLHGVQRAVRGEVTLTRRSGGIRAEARFPVRLPDYDIPEPRYLGIGVRDDVEVRVDAVFAASGGTR